ncbi:MAG: SDR family oxidoreductase [Bacilli bacterium]|nr:SDR family oxidoreductase [Bacilli bacterium]
MIKNVLIIGGSSDIGRKLATYLNNNGYNVLIGYYKHSVDIEGVYSHKCDVRNADSIIELIEYGIDLFEKIDILINLASINMDNSYLNKTKYEFMNVLEVNLVGMFLCNQIYSRYFSDGLIINMSSTDGIDTYSEYSIDYSVSKAGIICMSKNISMCTKNKVVCLCPNWIESDSTRSMDEGYLKSELTRIGQSRLITIDELIMVINDVINFKYNSGDVIRIDIKDDKLWIKKM